MAFIDYRLPFRPSPDHPPKDSPEDLQKLIWERWARIHMGNRLRGRAYAGIFQGGYIDSQARGGLETKKWKPEGGELLFRFHDAEGLFALQSRACAHFTEVSFATMLAEDHFTLTMRHEGWVLEPPRDATTALNQCDTPFIDLRGVLYMLSPGASPGAPPALLTDPRLPPLAFADLRAPEKAAVVTALEERRCACLLCQYYRPRIVKVLERRAAKAAREQLKNAKKSAKNEVIARKASSKKATAKKATAKKATAKKATAKKATAKKTPVKKLR